MYATIGYVLRKEFTEKYLRGDEREPARTSEAHAAGTRPTCYNIEKNLTRPRCRSRCLFAMTRPSNADYDQNKEHEQRGSIRACHFCSATIFHCRRKSNFSPGFTLKLHAHPGTTASTTRGWSVPHDQPRNKRSAGGCMVTNAEAEKGLRCSHTRSGRGISYTFGAIVTAMFHYMV